MIKFFRKIRQKMLIENKFSKYLIYAIGEIILVVIGILIALAINNSNEKSKLEAQELVYLESLKNDLSISIVELDKYIETRENRIISAKIILEHFDGKPIEDLEAFNLDIANIYSWRKYFQNNNTYQELINSGNFTLISNNSVKNTLLNLETLYKKLKDEESHFRYDSEVLLYEPSYEMVDHHLVVENYKYHLSNGQIGSKIPFKREQFEAMLSDLKQKNGFAMAILEFEIMNQLFEEMKQMSKALIQLIDNEIGNSE